MMNTVLNGLTSTRYFVFLDDIIYARPLAEHCANYGSYLKDLENII
jgi:hypothetical protein